MRDYGKISTSLWQSKKFASLKDDAAKYFYLYLHTCPHVNSIGCFRLPIGYAKTDLEWDENQINSAIKALCKALLIGWNNDEQVILLNDFLKHSPCTNDKHAQGASKLALMLPDCYLKLQIIQQLQTDRFAGKIQAIYEYEASDDSPMDSPMDTTETETETETEPEKEYAQKAIEQEFKKFWDIVPRKVGKKKVEAEFKRIIKRGEVSVMDIQAGMESYSDAVKDVEPQFIAHPITWLNRGGWDDEIAPVYDPKEIIKKALNENQ